ncbi:peptidase family M13, partial [Ostertagia ostertagi]
VPEIARAVVNKDGYQVSIYEPDQYKKFNSDYNTTLDRTKLVNYLFMRLLLQNAQYLPTTAGGVIQNVIHSFQGMIDQLDWMTPEIKKKANEKTNGIIQNIAFPDWIMNNTLLDAYYKDLTFDPKDNYYDMWTKLILFNLGVQYKQLTAPSTDRHDFLGQPGTVNAWYQPELNSITFPAGILQPPYFHPKWPASINYGGMGLVAGHELTHGFDDEGVQWGPGGEIAFPANANCKGWMDQNSTAGFTKMAGCVIEEYNKFCPLDPNKYTPNCVNGAQTQGENIADNGGIHAAFRAYRTHIALDGPDPLLPDRLFGQFTHDQLFFLNFAQVWCEKERTQDLQYKQLMVDPHSPSKYRVFGTIQNYPAFQVAYNCPANSAYSPNPHCNVWVPFYEP